MIALFEILGTLLGAGLAASAAPTLLAARQQVDGAITGAVVRLVLGGLVLMACWKLFFCADPWIASKPSNEAVSHVAAAPSEGLHGCGKDTDCKGDRICVRGSCQGPSDPVPNAAAVVPIPQPNPVAATSTDERSFLEHFVYRSHEEWYWLVGKVLAALTSILFCAVCVDILNNGSENPLFTLTISMLAGWAWYWI